MLRSETLVDHRFDDVVVGLVAENHHRVGFLGGNLLDVGVEARRVGIERDISDDLGAVMRECLSQRHPERHAILGIAAIENGDSLVVVP